MLHECPIAAIIATQLAEIIRILLPVCEQDREAGKRRVARITTSMYNTRIWQRQMDKPRVGKVRRHLVRNPLRRRCSVPNSLNVVRTQSTQLLARYGRN